MLSIVARNLLKQRVRSVGSLLVDPRNAGIGRIFYAGGANDMRFWRFGVSSDKYGDFLGGARGFSARSMRSRVEKRMERESGKTLREMRRAKKLRKKLMTVEERLIYNLRRAKKKVALLLQKLKKYELPELPAPRHDPEILTPEQIQAYKKIGFRNRNYVPVGVRGVFGGVVQNMHMHWKFHETVQVSCDNFPKEKIKEMAIMLARLSGGIVVNIHNTKTIIMFRGRNYRQPKVLIPINTLTKRKALFKARFEQALESQKLNIKKIEQELRKKGINPDDPVAMASIQRVASTFFNAIDKSEGSPYVFREDTKAKLMPDGIGQSQDAGDDSDQEELDRFIAEIEDAADKEWKEEEEAEKEELGRLRYWNRDDFGSRVRRSEFTRGDDDDDDDEVSEKKVNRNQRHIRTPMDDEDKDEDETDDEDKLVDDWDANDDEEENGECDGDAYYGKTVDGFSGREASLGEFGRKNGKHFERRELQSSDRKKNKAPPKDFLSDLDDFGLTSEEEGDSVRKYSISDLTYRSSSTDEEN